MKRNQACSDLFQDERNRFQVTSSLLVIKQHSANELNYLAGENKTVYWTQRFEFPRLIITLETC